jgi:hypothetical protein
MRFTSIEDRRADYPATIPREVLGVSPAGYYAWRSRRRADDPPLELLVQPLHRA